jgi:hypothetical protein
MSAVAQAIAPHQRISRREQYRSMLRLAAAHSPRRETLATRGVDEVCAVLQRHDRIEWCLRLWSRDLLHFAEHMPAFSRNQRRRLHRLRRAHGSPAPNGWWNERERFVLDWWRLQVASGRVPFLRSTLARVNLWRFRTFRQANTYLYQLEQEVDRIEVHQNAVDDFLVFPNGWRWVRCAYDSSEVEGKLMRHCGNRGNWDPECELLSLREPDKVDQVSFWRPHLTFALKEGYLGEMKGRNNAKPSRKYHPYIQNLLRDRRIKGLSPELGALPGNDFELTDLGLIAQEWIVSRQPPFAYRERAAAMQRWRARQAPRSVTPPIPALPPRPPSEPSHQGNALRALAKTWFLSGLFSTVAGIIWEAFFK